MYIPEYDVYILCNMYMTFCIRLNSTKRRVSVFWDSNPALTKTLLDLGTPLDELLTADST